MGVLGATWRKDRDRLSHPVPVADGADPPPPQYGKDLKKHFNPQVKRVNGVLARGNCPEGTDYASERARTSWRCPFACGTRVLVPLPSRPSTRPCGGPPSAAPQPATLGQAPPTRA